MTKASSVAWWFKTVMEEFMLIHHLTYSQCTATYYDRVYHMYATYKTNDRVLWSFMWLKNNFLKNVFVDLIHQQGICNLICIHHSHQAIRHCRQLGTRFNMALINSELYSLNAAVQACANLSSILERLSVRPAVRLRGICGKQLRLNRDVTKWSVNPSWVTYWLVRFLQVIFDDPENTEQLQSQSHKYMDREASSLSTIRSEGLYCIFNRTDWIPQITIMLKRREGNNFLLYLWIKLNFFQKRDDAEKREVSPEMANL